MAEKVGQELNKENNKNKEKMEYKNVFSEILKNNQNVNDIPIRFNLSCKSIIQVVLTQFGFILILALVLFISYLIPEYHSKKIFTSKNGLEFTQDPLIMIHLTDIHISVNKKERTDGSSILMMSLIEYNPDLFLLTGDLVDNVKTGQDLGCQNLEEWKMYNMTIKGLLVKKGFKVIEVSGNHEQWGVDKYNSIENNYLDYSFTFNRTNVKNESDFFLRKINVNINNIDLTFLLLNDYRYPVYRPPYGLEQHTTTEQLNLLEKTMNSLEEKDIFILSHYHVDRAWLLKSSNKKTFGEIISNKKVYAIFTGHEHPSEVKIIHHSSEGGLEFCTASAFDKKKAGLVTLDNGNLVYHEVYIPNYGSKPLFFLSYPTPNEQISSHHYFNTKNFEIRVISYVSDVNIKLKIEGDIDGYLVYDHPLKNGALLFKYSVNNLKEGTYNIHIYDENGYGCNINTEFTIGEKYEGRKEKYIIPVGFLLTCRFLIIPYFLCLLIIVFPFFPTLNIPIVKRLEGNIEDENQIYNNKVLNPILKYLFFIILSPFFLRLRLQENPHLKKVLRYALFCGLIYPLILPVHFMQSIKGKVGYSFFVFVVLDGKATYQHWSLQFTFFYYATTLLSFILFASGKKYYNKKNIIFVIINVVIFFALIIASMIINFKGVAQSISLGYLFFSTAYVYIFLILLILFIIFFF